jgi:RNA polymerase sigma-70 factor (ECF subfamily)
VRAKRHLAVGGEEGVDHRQLAAQIGSTPASSVPGRWLACRDRSQVAFFAAARDGDFDALVAVLDPDVVLCADGGTARGRPTIEIHGAQAVAEQAGIGSRFARFVRPALINGTAGAVVASAGRAFSIMGFTVVHGKIVAIDVLYDPERLAELDLTVLDDSP